MISPHVSRGKLRSLYQNPTWSSTTELAGSEADFFLHWLSVVAPSLAYAKQHQHRQPVSELFLCGETSHTSKTVTIGAHTLRQYVKKQQKTGLYTKMPQCKHHTNCDPSVKTSWPTKPLNKLNRTWNNFEQILVPLFKFVLEKRRYPPDVWGSLYLKAFEAGRGIW